VRFRVDGVLRNAVTLPKNSHSAIISRIKIMAEMDIAEKRLPQMVASILNRVDVILICVFRPCRLF